MTRRSMCGASPATQSSGSPSSPESGQTVPRMPGRCTMRCCTPRSGSTVPSAKGAASGRRCSRAAIQPPCFCANSLASRTLPRGGMVRMTSRLGGMDAQRIAARLAVAADAHRIDRLVEDDLDRLRFARTAIEQGAQRHFEDPNLGRDCRSAAVLRDAIAIRVRSHHCGAFAQRTAGIQSLLPE